MRFSFWAITIVALSLALTSCATTYPLQGPESSSLDGGAHLSVMSFLPDSGKIMTDVDGAATLMIFHYMKPESGMRFCRVEVIISNIPKREITIPFKQVKLVAQDGTVYQPIAVQMAGSMTASFEFPAKYVEVLPNLEGKVGTSKTKEELLEEEQKANPGMKITIDDGPVFLHVRLFYEVPEKAKLIRVNYFDQSTEIQAK